MEANHCCLCDTPVTRVRLAAVYFCAEHYTLYRHLIQLPAAEQPTWLRAMIREEKSRRERRNRRLVVGLSFVSLPFGV